MTSTYTFTPEILPSAGIVLFLLALAVYTWYRRKTPGALPLTIACLFAALWAAGTLLEYAAVDVATKILWVKFQTCWFVPLTTAVTCFILEYAWPGRWLTRRNLILLSLPCLPAIGLILTNDLHHLAWRSYEFQGTFLPQFGLSSWIYSVYGLGLLGILNLLVFGWLFLRSSPQRWPVILMLVGQVGGRTVFLLAKTDFILSALPIDLLGMSFEFLMYAIALFDFRILDPIPMARQKMIEQLPTGMVVLDPTGVIVSLNPAAQAILGLPEKHLLNRPINEFLPIGDGMKPAGQAEIRLGNGQETRYYQLETSTLNDWRGLEAGRLLMLRDVTGQKQAQAQLLEQQRALAMLQEREQLARELHDSIAQVLSYASLKASAARKLIAGGNLAKADDQLAHMEGSLTEAQADVREYILNLRIAPIGDKPFFTTLQNYLDGFRQNYAIQVEVFIDPNVDEDGLAPEVQVQLFRILQEALSNARKHAATNHVNVSFGKQDGRVRMRVQDQGKGFDPQQSAGADSSHFGLVFMRERAESLGGGLRVQSVPGEGTCVEVEVPVNGEASHA